MTFWTTDHYTWVYGTILDHAAELRGPPRKHRRFPALVGPS